MKQVPPGAPRHQGGHIRGCGHARIVGPTRPRHVASQILQRSLLVQLILRTGNQRVSRLRLHRPLPATLYCPRLDTCDTRAGAVDRNTRYPGHHGPQTMYLGHPLHTLAQHLNTYVSGTPPPLPIHQEPSAESQRLINIVNTTTFPRIQRVSDAPAT